MKSPEKADTKQLSFVERRLWSAGTAAMRTYRTGSSWNGVDWPTGVSGDLPTWIYDPASGQVTAKTDAANQSVAYTYTVDGKLASRTWARGIVTNYSYDAATGELLNIDYADSTRTSHSPTTASVSRQRFRMRRGRGRSVTMRPWIRYRSPSAGCTPRR